MKHREPQPILLREVRRHSTTSESASRRTSQATVRVAVQQPSKQTRMLLNTSFQTHSQRDAVSSVTVPVLQPEARRRYSTSQMEAASSVTVPDAGMHRFCGGCGHPWEPGGCFCGNCGMQRENAL
jgi:NADH pyrophosphatase NudC (nudix superfamily)